MESTTERRGFRVTGHVQGVGFRWSATKVAQGMGLKGSIRNTPDGAVEVSAAGTRDSLDRFARWLRKGPRGALVESVDETAPLLPIPEEGFRIVR